jgi:pyruvate dehydrogenase E2 component (dihydrolipoamide acetyltransferase)
MYEFRMPSLGADMDFGTIVDWRVAPGDEVVRGQIVAEVETEKSNIEIEVFTDGCIHELLVPLGVEVAVGTPLATIATADEPSPAAPTPTPPADAGMPEQPTTPETTPELSEIAPAHGRVTSPLVRRLANQLHVDLDAVVPTGRAATITRADVEHAAESAAGPAAAPATPRSPRPQLASRPRISPRARRRAAELGVDLALLAPSRPGGAIVADDVQPTMPSASATSRVRPSVAPPRVSTGLSPAVGRLMERSKREIPHYYVSDDIDLTSALRWLERTNAQRSVSGRVLSAALLLRAVVVAAREVPEMNGHYVDGCFHPSEPVHLAIAVSLRQGGLIAPVVRDADKLQLPELMSAMRDVVERARTGTLRSRDVEAGTITVTNLGDRGASSVFGVIIPPQVAIVGFGKITERPWAVGGLVGARSIVTASLSADHRVSHGHTGSRFLGAIREALSRPEDL